MVCPPYKASRPHEINKVTCAYTEVEEYTYSFKVKKKMCIDICLFCPFWLDACNASAVNPCNIFLNRWRSIT